MGRENSLDQMRLRRSLPVILFDFDGTLAPCTSTQLLRWLTVDPGEFFDSTHMENMPDIFAFNQKLMETCGSRITEEVLCDVGRSVQFFPGVLQFMEAIRPHSRIGVLTCGLLDIVMATGLERYVDVAMGTEFDYGPSGIIKATKKIFLPSDKAKFVELLADEVPGTHIAYVGDGLTDKPAWKAVKNVGGLAIAVGSEERDIGIDFCRLTDALFKPDFRCGSALQERLADWIKNLD